MSTTTTTLSVAGMTCQHCVQAVTTELTALDGVQDVAIDLRSDGPSLVRVVSDRPLDDAALDAAVDEAGYEVVRP